MRYLRGEVLGLFCGELGIRPSSRVAVTHARQGLFVWDLGDGVEFHLNFKKNTLHTRRKPAPEHCDVVFQQSDRALLARINDPDLMPWNEERETLVSELRYRRIAHASRPRYPVRLLFTSLVAHLTCRLNPLRILRRPRYGSSPCS
ncbi:MAG TPA: hypothetical protein VIM62_00395 [Acidobacteriaceae bacterium]